MQPDPQNPEQPEQPDPTMAQDLAAQMGAEPDAPPEQPGQAIPPQQAPQVPQGQAPGELSPEELASLVEFRNWAQQNPQFVAAMADVLEGRASIVPADATPSPVDGAGAAGQQVPPAPDDDLALPEPAANRMREMQQELRGVQQFVYDNQYQQNLAAIDRGSSEFQRKYGMTTEEVAALEQEVAQAQLLPVYTQQMGDAARGMTEAMEHVYFRNPAFRQREVERQAQANAGAVQRQAKAGKLAGTSGSAPRVSQPTGNTPPSRQQMVENIAADIRASQSGQAVE